ncbi:MAG TPA: aminotransferase class I/II-fold pyridoxal phosphate-dependent enzyme [Desulfobacteraceae bacterium]|nr:aminotransferase class I/II-fold pyridoxal phosphate-dependent enzyme [Desulfobacteraceae bacterium]
MGEIGRRKFVALAGGACAAAFAGCIRFPGKASVPNVQLIGAGKAQFPIILSSNENPLGPCPSAIEAGSKSVAVSSHRYAREQRDGLIMDLAEFYRLSRDQILLGCGAIELLKIAVDVFCSSDKPPIISDPVYEAIDYFAGLKHVHPLKIPAKSHDTGHDLEAMLEALYSRGGGMVYVCNPCNPTGGVLDSEELADFIVKAPRDVVVVVDEAYAEYVGPDFLSCFDYVRSGMPNLLVIRTFSKVYGLAGLRVGYCAGSRELLGAMAGHRLWNNINQAGAAAAREALNDQDWVERVRRENKKAKQMFCAGLKKLGVDYIPSKTSFVLLSARRPWEEIYAFLRSHGIIGGRRIPSMPRHIRLSIGSSEEMAYCLKVLEKFVSL